METCVFCKIIKGELPSYTIYEDDVVKAFLSIEPIGNGHLLIIPKKHFVNICDIDIDVLHHINTVSKSMYNLLYEKLKFDGLKFVQNNGSLQDVMHYHLHLIPTYKDGKKMSLDDVYNILKND